ncbi:MAG TPA: sigma-70 family RNA polymerase sigma factor [Polyangiaceae bacterium]|nr:sigma-70 family RNA polymerase sigma factor [Polyangiaceae bacterium]
MEAREAAVSGASGPGEPAPADPALELDEARASEEDRARLALAAAQSFQFLWRLLRRLGVRPDASVDDAVQRVFEITARKVRKVPVGMERAFLFRTAVLVAAEERRRQTSFARRIADEPELELASPELDPESALAARRTRALLDEVLDSLPDKQRAVFVLFELEGLTCAEIAELLGAPPGTVASRLRLARAAFQDAAQRMRARHQGSRT